MDDSRKAFRFASLMTAAVGCALIVFVAAFFGIRLAYAAEAESDALVATIPASLSTEGTESGAASNSETQNQNQTQAGSEASASSSSKAKSKVKSGSKASQKAQVPKVYYRTRVGTEKWMDWKSDGKASGSARNAPAPNRFAAKLDAGTLKGGIKYSLDVAGIGWMDWKSNGATAGKRNRSIEAVRVKLTGAIAKEYDVYYQVRVDKYGWLDWAKNGAMAGAPGMSAYVGAVRLKLVKKGAAAPGKTETPRITNRWTGMEFKFRSRPDVKQLLEVRYTGGSSARVVLLKKKGSSWRTVLSCNGYVGYNGIDKKREGDGRTPTGTFGITAAFGIEDDPGAKFHYYQAYHGLYWCGDEAYYNQLIDIDRSPHYCLGEHLIDYSPHYNYGLFIDFNTNPIVYGAGSAIFIHCTGSSESTAGCVAVPEADMVKIIRTVDYGSRVLIYPA